MTLNLTVNNPTTDRTVVTTSGIMALTEALSYDGAFNSYATVLVSGLLTSGVYDTLNLQLYAGDAAATTSLSYPSLPSEGDTLTINSRVYTYTAVLSGVDQILLDGSLLSTLRHTYCTINASGLSGVDYYAGQTAHTTAKFDTIGNPMVLTSKRRGTIGNTLTAYVSGSSPMLSSNSFAGGKAAGSVPLYEATTPCSGVGTFEICPVSYPAYYTGHAWLSASGLDVVSQDASPSLYSVSGVFSGYEACLDFIEVSGLSGNLSGSGIDSSGELLISWNDMKKYRGPQLGLIARPYASGAQTQSTLSFDAKMYHESIYYYIFVWMSNTYSTPQCEWPRPTDSKGTWYYVGRTTKPYYTLTLPRGYNLAIWVGSGNPSALINTRTPLGSVTNLIS